MRDEEFLNALANLKRHSCFLDTRVEEYGIAVPDNAVEACTFQVLADIVIMVRQSSSFPLDENLEHELLHILRGHLNLDSVDKKDEENE